MKVEVGVVGAQLLVALSHARYCPLVAAVLLTSSRSDNSASPIRASTRAFV